jgi:hypothetical protein
MHEDEQRKLDSQLRYRLNELTATGAADDAISEPLSLFILGSGPFTDEQLAELEADGVTIRTVAGDVLTADAPLDAVTRIQRHAWVRKVDASQPLHLEDPDDTASVADIVE